MDYFEKYYNSALRFLSFRPRSEKEIRDNLLKKKAATEIIEKIIAKLKEKNFLNDVDFAKWWIESRLNFKPRSLRLIKIELKLKGITDDIMEKLIYDLRFMNKDLENAKKLLQKKLTKIKDLNKEGTYKKLGGFLVRKGFDWDTIKQVIDELIGKRV